jgi:glycosyltransferase involved in cell wall biosynthesis
VYEGFGLPAAEALACQTPVVATDAGAVGEVVTPDCGVLVPPRDPVALAAAIQALLDEPGRRDQMGLAGRERMAREFSWPVCAANTVAVYAKVLAQRAGVVAA